MSRAAAETTSVLPVSKLMLLVTLDHPKLVYVRKTWLEVMGQGVGLETSKIPKNCPLHPYCTVSDSQTQKYVIYMKSMF